MLFICYLFKFLLNYLFYELIWLILYDIFWTVHSIEHLLLSIAFDYKQSGKSAGHMEICSMKHNK